MMVSKNDILNARILIVDDQQSNIWLLEQMLSDAGYQCVTSTLDPYEVCELHQGNHYDLILLDLQMPGKDGFQVMEELEIAETDSYVPILVITAQPGHKLRALSSGAKDFVSKPFELVEVTTRIHNMLEVRLLYKKLEAYSLVLEQKVWERTAELRESEARFQRLSELASDWYWEQDVNGHFTKVYGPVLEMLGVPVETLLNEIQKAQVTHWNEEEKAMLAANMAARRPFLDLVYSRVDNGGEHQYFQVSGEPMFDSVGRFTGYRGVGKDVTDIMNDAASLHAA